MKRLVVIAALFAVPAWAQQVTVPSGLTITLYEVLLEEEPEKMARFRFVAPQIKGGAVPFAEVVADVDYLCQSVVVPGLAENGWTRGSVVISLAEVATPFGEPAPEITQYFQPYNIADGVCSWDQF